MRRFAILAAVAIAMLAAAAYPVAPPALRAQPAGPVAIPPGAVPLIQDEPDHPGLPLHFRTMTDPFPEGGGAPLPLREGLERLRASGSAQFSRQQLKAVIDRVGGPLVVVDLRLESHGFLDGVSVSWYAFHDQVNVVRSYVEAQQDEQRRLATLRDAGQVTALVPDVKGAKGEITQGHEVLLTAETVQTERELARSLGLGYIRITATDFVAPRSEEVDRFVAVASGLPPETWLHLHCHGGDGRTTTFLAIWDMMHNAERVGVEEIVRRQALLGPVDLFAPGDESSWAYPFAVERARFIRRFHQYARENVESGFVQPWSAWSAAHP